MNKEYYKMIHQLISAGHWITDSASMALREFGMTEPQYNVLRILDEAQLKPLAINTIQNKMVQRSSNVTRIVDKLLEKGLIERHECMSNRRKKDITLTQSGILLLKELDRKVHEFHSNIISNLSNGEINTLKLLIIKLRQGKY